MLRQQADLAEEEGTLLRSVLDATSDAVFVKDLDGRYVLANGAATAMLGRTGDGLIGLTDADLWPAAADSLMARDRAALCRQAASTTEEVLPVTAGAMPRVFRTSRAP
ncbi:PAS domain-containing protein [Paracraurococcus ruber]|uniref:PAS domain-containing protein n=1 Tax=Paracraurococcus ruber TaxID=77675 RepID=A0ABS1D448_9PROT|nr:PAS domain-containing protein [Paracraurococcus ruber]MBK1660857.1 hypothetical protein [Paracraurococcus ruber]TDG27036.1 PAS domain-containing protein [Paracraurococcus ruber]